MIVSLENTGRRYNLDWIFRGITKRFESGSRTAILGRNGSGKSTLLKVISGALLPSEGNISYVQNGKEISRENIYASLSLASPYLDIPSSLTGTELVSLHRGFRPLMADTREFFEIAGLSRAKDKKLGSYSSGMRQRVKLALAILSEAPMLLLDEPHSNLDAHAMEWYGEMMNRYAEGKTVFVCSNHQPQEYFFCSRTIDLSEGRA